MKICWMSNIPSPYKVQLMNLIGQDLELLCVFEKRNEDGRNDEWIDENHEFFKSRFINELSKKEIEDITNEYDILINSNYTNLKFMRITRKFKKKKKLVLLHADGGLVIPRGLFDKVISLFMKQFDYYLSSGEVVNKYFNYYGIENNLIFNYRFSSITKDDLIRNAELRKCKEELKAKNNIEGKKVILSVGQQIHRKGYDVLCKSMINISNDIELFIIGGFPEKITKEICEKNELSNIHFENFKTKKELMKFYAMADIFVLPTRYDIWGLVINEAMSFGLPIISTDKCVAAMEFNRIKENAIIVKSDSIAELTQAIENLLNNDEKLIRLGRNSLETIKFYTIEDTKEDFVSILSKISQKC